MIISNGKATAESKDTLSTKAVEAWHKNSKAAGLVPETVKIQTVKKITTDIAGESTIGPDTTAKSWWNIQEFETDDTMTIVIVEE